MQILLWNMNAFILKNTRHFKMRNLLRFALFVVLAIACATNVYCQTNDPEFIPKGEYAVYNSGKSTSVSYNNVIYSADATEMMANWTFEGFVVSDSSLSTGVYSNGIVYKAVSPVVEVPYGQHCYLKLNSKLHSESHFDNARVEVVLRNGERHLVYTASGVKNRYDEFINIHWFSGYRVQFVFTFECDSTFNGDGWDIYEMALCNNVPAPVKKKGLLKNPASTQQKGGLQPADNTINSDSISMMLMDSTAKVNIYGVTWDNTEKTKGSVSFSLTDKNGNYIDLFSFFHPNNHNTTHIVVCDTVIFDSTITDAIKLNVNGKEVKDCKEIKQDKSHQKLDIIYAVDCSASMEKYQNQLKISIDSLNSLLKNRYDLRSAVLFFRWNRPENWELHDFTYDYKFNNTYKNVGSTTYCFSVLKYLSKVNLSYNDQSQKIIILLGNQDGDHLDDYEGGKSLSPTEVSQMLREKGFQTYVIYDQEFHFKTITDNTNGGFFQSDNFLIKPEAIASHISNSLKYRYFMEFCMPDTAAVCQDSALIQLSIDKDKADSINSKVLYMPKLDLTSEWKQYDEGERCYAKKMNGDSLHIGFTVHNPCETDTIRNVMVYYGYNGDSSLSHQNPALMQDDSIWRATIPLCDTVQSVRYKIKAENSWTSINYPAVGEKVDNLLKQWFVVRTDCEPMCGSFSLSSNPVTSKSDTLGFNVGYKCDIRFALLDRKGNPIPRLSGRLKKTRTYEAGTYSEPLSKIFPGLFRMGLDPLTPYLLVVSNGNEVFMTYVYISRL